MVRVLIEGRRNNEGPFYCVLLPDGSDALAVAPLSNCDLTSLAVASH